MFCLRAHETLATALVVTYFYELGLEKLFQRDELNRNGSVKLK
jgi:hypothetical protein